MIQSRYDENLPNLIVPGAQKAGTTYISNLLSQHPDIFIPESKEVHYFDREKNYSRGLNWYEKFYADSRARYRADITPEYLFLSNVPRRIKKDLSDEVEFLICLRNPVERAYSQYWGNKSRGFEDRDFSKAIMEDTSAADKERKVRFAYKKRGLYAEQIKRYYETFAQSNIKAIIFERFIAEPEAKTKEVFEFLGVDDSINLEFDQGTNQSGLPRFAFIRDLIENKLIRKIGEKLAPGVWMRQKLLSLEQKIRGINKKPVERPPLSDEVKNYLRDYYQHDVEELEVLTGKDLSLWDIN